MSIFFFDCRLNEHISAELDMNPELESIKTILGRSYDGLSYISSLVSCICPSFPKTIRLAGDV
jgi:hypothetical protein